MHAALLILLLVQTPLETDPVKIVAGTAFDIYRAVISPAQGDVCNFTPSCSRYASDAIARYGLLRGSLMASERLLRCNPWAYQSFGTHYDEIRDMKFHDPVETNCLFDPETRLRPEDTLRAERGHSPDPPWSR